MFKRKLKCPFRVKLNNEETSAVLFCEKIDELVISLELTQETTFLAIDLISAWILRDLTKHRMKNYIKTVAGLRNIITQQYNLETV